tara:strand:+ start:36160 stop:36333 length:174 start_codon:yes stop_codon:yes gene_type:complete
MSSDNSKIEVEKSYSCSGLAFVVLIFLFWGKPDIHDLLTAYICEKQSLYVCKVNLYE